MKYSRKYELAQDALERGQVLYMYTWEILGGKRGSNVPWKTFAIEIDTGKGS